MLNITKLKIDKTDDAYHQEPTGNYYDEIFQLFRWYKKLNPESSDREIKTLDKKLIACPENIFWASADRYYMECRTM